MCVFFRGGGTSAVDLDDAGKETQIWDVPGTYTYVIPSGASEITVEVWGQYLTNVSRGIAPPFQNGPTCKIWGCDVVLLCL